MRINQLNMSPFVNGSYVGYADPASNVDYLKEYTVWTSHQI